MSVEAACPNCGGPIRFGVDTSLVTICSHCGAAAGRGGGKLESYGIVGNLAPSDSPLQIGIRGDARGIPFEVTGRTQLRHAGGGVWNEWYLSLRDGQKWGWLAEAQGRYYLTFPKSVPGDFAVPDNPRVDATLEIPQVGALKVVEVGQATVIGAEGELPFELRPGETVRYIDLQGGGGKFATIDLSESPPQVFVGGEFPLERLGIRPEAETRDEPVSEAAAVSIQCPQCGAALELRAPDESLRVVCGYCDSLLDVEQAGHGLRFFEALGKQAARPLIPLGAEGELRGRRYRVIGFLQRKVHIEGRDYFWQEYLLHTPRQPFHWLIHSDNHWSLGRPVSAGDVHAEFRTATCEGRAFRAFARSSPVVTAVYGEFYWQVRRGERAFAADYVAPPLMLSREETTLSPEQQAAMDAAISGQGPPPTDISNEVHYTLSEYLERRDVEQAFGVQGLPRPANIAPHQPYPHRGIFPIAAVYFAAAMALAALFFATGPRRQIFRQQFNLNRVSAPVVAPVTPLSPTQPGLSPTAPTGMPASTEPESSNRVFFSDTPVEVHGHRNLRVTLESPVDNSWVYVAGDLFNEQSGMVQPYDAEVAYYHGVEGGESWSEGSHRRRTYVGAVPPGKYTLRFEFQWDKMQLSDTQATITVHEGVPRILHLFLALLALGAIPVGVLIHQITFESGRWSESDFAGGDDDE